MTPGDLDAHHRAVADAIRSGRRRHDEGGRVPSPCVRYEARIAVYDGGSSLVRVVDRHHGRLLAWLLRDDDRLPLAWVARDDGPFLVCPEALEGGQTVVHLPTGDMASVIAADDPFIGTEIHPAPDGRRLAVIGCYWACPYEVVVCDFDRPMDLPLPPLSRRLLPENDWRFGRWLGPSAFTLLSPDGNEERSFDA